MYASSGNKHFFTKSCHRQTYQNYEQPPRTSQNSYFQSHFSVLKIDQVFIHVLEGQEKIKKYSLVVKCRRFHQVLRRQILHRLLAHIAHFHVEPPSKLLEK